MVSTLHTPSFCLHSFRTRKIHAEKYHPVKYSIVQKKKLRPGREVDLVAPVLCCKKCWHSQETPVVKSWLSETTQKGDEMVKYIFPLSPRSR